MRNRMLSLFLAFCMLVSVFTVPALAEGTESGAETAVQSGELAASQQEGAGQTDGGSFVSTGDSSTAGTSTPAGDSAQAGADTPAGDTTPGNSAPVVTRSGSVDYLDENGTAQTLGESWTAVTADLLTWTDGWYVVSGAVTMGSRVTVTGDVKLILTDGASLTVTGGINVGQSNSFTVYAQSFGDAAGALTAIATDASGDSGIGGGFGETAGNITVNGGRITAIGGNWGASGIGGGQSAWGGGNGGNITINNGYVVAQGKGGWDGGAGIGGGHTGGNGGTITITGGTVEATGGGNASGIGGSRYGDGGTITITGGNITATSGGQAAAIGGGDQGDGGTITISGGNVHANSTQAGIGGGPGGASGTFTTGESGTAVIYASSISDNDDTSTWNGIIFQGDEGKVYGNQSLGENLNLEAGKTLTVGADASLTVPENVTLSVYGNLTRQGAIANAGEILIYPGGSYTGTQTAPNPVRYAQVPYLDEYGSTQSADSVTVIQDQTSWTEGWYMVSGEVTIDSRVTVSGDVKLILTDGANLTVNGGINVGEGNLFTVYAQSTGDAMGALTVRNVAADQAGIGGYVSDSGAITIVGGILDVTGGTYAAGIGGGTGGSGNVTINGGIVTVNGVEQGGAGIGDGCQTELSTSGGTVTITGGIVTATGGGQVEGSPTYINGGAGIGGFSGGMVDISGGTVTATGGADGGAGIGGNYGQTGGTIIISGGTVTATGGANGGAGIGAGAYCNSDTIRISGGIVTATGSTYAAGIGDGMGGEGGIFITSPFSTAVIFASSISDNDDTGDWGGIIFQGDEGKAYSDLTAIVDPVTIPEGKTLTLENGQRLDNWSGAGLTNLGTIRVNQGGTYSGDQPTGNPVQYQMSWDTDGDGTVDDFTYVAYGEMPDHAQGTKDQDQQYSYTFSGWTPELKQVTAPAVYTAQFQPVLRSYTVTLPEGDHYHVNYSGSNVVEYGQTFTFTVELAPGYSESDDFTVAANGTPLTANADGSYTVRVEGDTQITVEGVADLIAPANLTVSYGTDSFKELVNTLTFGLIFKDTVTVTLSATDEGTGVQSFTYRLGDGQLQTVTAENGQYTFTVSPEFKGNLSGVTARDGAGNTTTEIAYEYFAVEGQAPNTPQVNALGAGQWTSGPVTFTLSGAQATSGIQKYQYSTDGGKTWQEVPATVSEEATVQNPVNVLEARLTVTENAATAQGVSYLFRAVSNAGNASQVTQSYLALIDKAAPGIEVTGDTGAYLTGDMVNVQASAGVSGVAKVEVALNGGDFQDITDSYNQGYAVTENGTYTFRVTSGAGLTGQASITYTKLDSAKPVAVIDSGSYTDGSWTTGDVTLSVSNTTANLGDTTFRYQVDGGDWQDWAGPITVDQDTVGTVYTFMAVSASGVESDPVSITVKRDTAAPEGDIAIQANSVKTLIHQITFGLFFNHNLDVTITGNDATSGVASIQYVRSREILTQEQVAALEGWTDYQSALSETAQDAEQFVYYVKVTDHAGNVTCYGSNGVTFDLTAPAISGVADGETCWTTQTVTVTDANLATVTLNGQPVEPTFTLAGNTDAVYTLVATDQAGNETSLTVTMKPIASLEEGLGDIDPDYVTSDDRDTIQDYIDDLEEQMSNDSLTQEERTQLEDMKSQAEDLLDQIDQAAQAGSTENIDKVAQITPDNVKPEDREDLEKAKEDLETALKEYGNHYTDQEKQQLEEALDRIESALETLDQVQQLEDAISALPDTVSPDDTQTEAAINTVKEAYDALTEHQQSLISQELRHKLESLLADLGDYRILQGNGSQWTQGSGSDLTIVANGAFSKFTGLLVDGQSVDAANYTAVSGSTVITLKADYLSTLSVGKHTLTVCYTDGQVSADFEILAQAASAPSAPATGDHSVPMMGVTLLVLAGAGALGLTLRGRKKKEQDA